MSNIEHQKYLENFKENLQELLEGLGKKEKLAFLCDGEALSKFIDHRIDDEAATAIVESLYNEIREELE